MKGLMTHIMMIAMPLLLTGMAVGLLVSLFQACLLYTSDAADE